MRIAQSSSRHSPLPVIRQQLNVLAQQPSQNVMQQNRSPIPTPRNLQNRVSESPSVNRRTDNISRPRTSTPILPRAESSQTAQLIHKLFRNRDPRLLPDMSEVTPLTPSNSRTSSQAPPGHGFSNTHEETIYSEIPSPTAPFPTERDDERDDDEGSEYLSLDNLSLTLNLDNIRSESTTPPPPYLLGGGPPPYRSIFDKEDR